MFSTVLAGKAGAEQEQKQKDLLNDSVTGSGLLSVIGTFCFKYLNWCSESCPIQSSRVGRSQLGTLCATGERANESSRVEEE